MRNWRWMDVIAVRIEHENFFRFAAGFRGLIESASDSYYTLGGVPLTLADSFEIVKKALEHHGGHVITTSKELEDRLIHFVHARKLRGNEKKENPASHNALFVNEYLEPLEKSCPSVRECYDWLCGLTHPASSSVMFVVTPDDDLTNWKLDRIEKDEMIEAVFLGDTDQMWMDAFSKKYQELAINLLILALNPASMTLKTLLHFPERRFHVKAFHNIYFAAIEGWRNVARTLDAACAQLQ